MKTIEPAGAVPAVSQPEPLLERVQRLRGERSVVPAAASPAATNPAVTVEPEGQPQLAPKRYLIGHNRQAGITPLSLAAIFPVRNGAFDSEIKGVTVLRKLPPPPGLERLGVLSALPPESSEIVVAEMNEETAKKFEKRELERRVQGLEPDLVMEPNLPMRLPEASLFDVPDPPTRHPSVLWPQAGFNVTIRVLSSSGEPVSGAEVFAFGLMGQTGGLTDAQGRAQLSLFGESSNSISGLYVKPKSTYWDRWVHQPMLQAGADFEVRLRPLEEQFPGFPGQETLGWGYRAMKIDQLDPNKFDGAGIKIAIIDSGAAATHPDLQGQVEQQSSASLVDGGWDQDSIAHGSHCAGVIAGLRGNAGVRGIAPGARLFIYKIFPGGEFDHLIDALDRCIAAEVDVVNLSLGADARSTFVEERLRAARNSGVACIVAAGNSAGSTQFPATSSEVLAVAAIGKTGQFPADSYHSQQVYGTPDANGYFSAKFTCSVPETGLCAPGVAIVSSVPDRGYAAWDGTSMAGPHVTGLAALILAHHPDFKSPPFSNRNAQRVDRLFQILRTTAQRLNLRSGRTGAGLPDAIRALNAAPAPGQESGGTSDTDTTLGSGGNSSLLERIRALQES